MILVCDWKMKLGFGGLAMTVGDFKLKMGTVETRGIVSRREIDGYERMSVEMKRRAGVGSGCGSKVSVDVDVLCVVSEGLVETMEMLGRDEMC